jgi:hypothetical protein
VSAEHDINALMMLLAPRGSYVVVGLPPKPPTLNHFRVVQKCVCVHVRVCRGVLRGVFREGCRKALTRSAAAANTRTQEPGVHRQLHRQQGNDATYAPVLRRAQHRGGRRGVERCGWVCVSGGGGSRQPRAHTVPCPSLLLMLLHTPMEQVIDIDYVNEAMKRMEKGDVHFRFVIDINKSLIL